MLRNITLEMGCYRHIPTALRGTANHLLKEQENGVGGGIMKGRHKNSKL